MGFFSGFLRMKIVILSCARPTSSISFEFSLVFHPFCITSAVTFYIDSRRRLIKQPVIFVTGRINSYYRLLSLNIVRFSFQSRSSEIYKNKIIPEIITRFSYILKL